MILLLRDLLEQFVKSENLALGLSIAIVTSAVLLASYAANFITKKFLVHFFRAAISRISPRWGTALLKYKVIHRFSHLTPALVIYLGANLFDIAEIPATIKIVAAVQKISQVCMLVIVAMVIDACINTIDYIYNYYSIAKKMPIRTYLQVVKLLLYTFVGILIISLILDKSPLAFIAGLGAVFTVLLVIFRDSILGFLTSIQLAAYDMVRIGDWIEMPSLGVDGDVIDISLNIVKIRNFDKTITTIPTHSLISSGVKNWRGMQEAGGRRIKRSLFIDMKSIQFCTSEMLAELKKLKLIEDYINNKVKEVEKHNALIDDSKSPILDQRFLTNVGCFRAYINAYLRHNTNIHTTEGYTFLIRQLQPTEKGLPIELYIFCKNTNWIEYEEIQSDIFDHLISMMPKFKLNIYQNLSGKDFEFSSDFKVVKDPKQA